MFLRNSLGLGVLAWLAIAARGRASESATDGPLDDVYKFEERVNPAVTIVAKIIGSMFSGAAVSCTIEAATACKDHWRHPAKALDCAKDFLKSNKGRCAIGS